jgi:hypothetical protein
LAVTDVAALIVTVQLPVPEQPPPLQPVKVDPAAGVAVSVTAAPLVNDAEQVVPHEMPAGLLVTVPVPVPARETVSVEVVPTPVPDTSRESVSPSAANVTFALACAAVVGVKRTVTVWVPVPTKVNGLPETILNGAETEAVPVTVPARTPCTVKVCVAELPIVTLPKLTLVVGVTAKSTCATALAAGEHALSTPPVSTAVTDTLYRVPVVRPVSRNPTCWLGGGDEVDVAT